MRVFDRVCFCSLLLSLTIFVFLFVFVLFLQQTTQLILRSFLDAKRKGDDLDVSGSAKSRKIERKCVDLIVLGIPWKSTEEVVRRYFEQYGEVVLCEVNEMKRLIE